VTHCTGKAVHVNNWHNNDGHNDLEVTTSNDHDNHKATMARTITVAATVKMTTVGVIARMTTTVAMVRTARMT